MKRTDEFAIVVRKFSKIMEGKLVENSHKGGWEDCDINYLVRRIREETKEVHKAILQKLPKSEILRECADVANFALMVADNFGGLQDENTN